MIEQFFKNLFNRFFPGESAVVASAHFFFHLFVGLFFSFLALAFNPLFSYGALVAVILVVFAEFKDNRPFDWYTRLAGWTVGALFNLPIIVGAIHG